LGKESIEIRKSYISIKTFILPLFHHPLKSAT